jgi:2',3'-cyclic-nucleotide 2'-phosphodiesterase (5'-nucleotidase family)
MSSPIDSIMSPFSLKNEGTFCGYFQGELFHSPEEGWALSAFVRAAVLAISRLHANIWTWKISCESPDRSGALSRLGCLIKSASETGDQRTGEAFL